MAIDLRATGGRLARRVTLEARALAVLRQAGMADPRLLVTLARHNRQWRSALAGAFATWADLTPDRDAVVDEDGRLTYREVHQRTNALARGLREEGAAEGATVAVLCRNGRGFIDASLAASKLGARLLLLNTGFAGPQLADVLDREGATVVLFDPEFEDAIAGATTDRVAVVATDDTGGRTVSTGDLIRRHLRVEPDHPTATSRIVILTSGTTGTPKGANRPDPPPYPSTAAMMFSRIPYRPELTFVIAAPAFHAWGLAQLLMCSLTGGTAVLHRRFDPETTLAAIAEHRADALAVVPVMLQRILALPTNVRGRYDCSSLSLVVSSGSALPGSLATAWMDAFGDNLYNFYGSTEVASATIADPSDMRAAPGTAGRPPLGTEVRLLDRDGREVPTGEVGRIFVGNTMQFDGYTGGGSKEMVDGLMATGDLGRVDADGRLFVEGRDDDMIVSGGENVFPREVEDLLADHPELHDVGVVGVEDREFGQRLVAFVVRQPGSVVTEPDLQAYVKTHLANYKAPRSVVFVDEIPRNPTGKVLRRELQSRA
jgi:fatty-acyl-CoA synthase